MIGINSTVLFLCLASILDSMLDHRINPFETIGPNFGIGLLIGYNGFLAAKLSIHLRRTFGLAILIPIVSIYGATGASVLAVLPVSEGTKAAATIPFILVPAAFAYQEEI